MKFLNMAKQQDDRSRVSLDVGLNLAEKTASERSQSLHLASEVRDSAEAAVAALYQASAVGLIRLAFVMLGDLESQSIACQRTEHLQTTLAQ